MSLTMTVSRPDSPYSFHWETAASSWGRQAAPLAQGMLRAHAPVGYGPRAGRLRNSISYREELSPGLLLLIFYTTVKYAPFVLKGTRPHLIMPRRAGGVLRWVDRVGNPSFATQVHHPGTKPNPFNERAMEVAGPGVARLFAEAVKEAVV